jgi:acetyl-CoA carboxylase biotin carboxyl carrier protein
VDLRKIKKLIDLLEESNLTELEVREGEETVRLSRLPTGPTQYHYSPPPVMAQPPASGAPNATSPKLEAPVESPAGITIRAPMVGTFYASRTPGAPPFITEGQVIKVGDPIGIIEAMKMFNPIESEHAGTVKRVLIENGQPVEFDQPLFVIE